MVKKDNRGYGFITQTMVLFAISILMMLLLAALFGDGAKEISPLYQMGSKGLASTTILEFLLSSAIITALKELFFSEKIFKNLMTLWRTVLMLFSVLIVSIIFIIVFKWFPLNFGLAWAGFLICFGGSCAAVSIFLIIKTRIDSKRYEELLDDYKKQHEDYSDEE